MPSALTNFYCTSVPEKRPNFLRPLIAMNTRSPNYLVIKSEEDDNIFVEDLCTTTKPPSSPIIGNICHYKYSREFLLDYCSQWYHCFCHGNFFKDLHIITYCTASKHHRCNSNKKLKTVTKRVELELENDYISLEFQP